MTTKGRSNIGSVALFTGQETDQDGFWTAAQSCLILRLTNFASKDWKPEILLSILRSAFIQRQLKEASMVSSSVPLLRIERICSLLVPDLTDDQKGKIQPLFERVSENRNELQKMQQKLEAKQKELQDLQADIDKVIFDS